MNESNLIEESLHSLTLVLSSARSGSTLLCRDIESLGGLGAPKEYLNTRSENRMAKLTEAEVLERVAQGAQASAPGVAAVKLMVPQVFANYEAVGGDISASHTDAMSGFVSWARGRFDRVLLVVLVRNSVDQAISRVVAAETGIYHSTSKALRQGRPVEVNTDGINERIFAQLGTVFKHRKALQTVAANHSDISLLLTYDDLTVRAEETTQRILAHARAQGFRPQNESATRNLTKVISPDRSASLRDSFLDFLRTEPGL